MYEVLEGRGGVIRCPFVLEKMSVGKMGSKPRAGPGILKLKT